MNPHERDLTPEEEAEVTRLLAQAGGPVTTPPEVVARLDDVLAGLVAERGEPGAPPVSADDRAGGSPVVVSPGVASLAERRRRRWPRVLLAAAAVVAGGYGIGVAISGTSMSGDAGSATSADAGGDTGGDTGGAGAGAESRVRGGSTQSQDAQPPAPANAMVRAGTTRLRPDHLADDVGRLLEELDSTPQRSAVPLQAPAGPALRACAPADLAPGASWFVVRYDARRAVLVTSPPEDGLVRAVVSSCAGKRLDAVAVPAP